MTVINYIGQSAVTWQQH